MYTTIQYDLVSFKLVEMVPAYMLIANILQTRFVQFQKKPPKVHVQSTLQNLIISVVHALNLIFSEFKFLRFHFGIM